MAAITINTDLKIQTTQVPVGDIKVFFDALMVTDPITIPVTTDPAKPVGYQFPYSGQKPFMLVVLPTLDPNNLLRDDDLTYATKAGAVDNERARLTGPQLFFNNSVSALSASTPSTLSLFFWNKTKLPVKVQLLVGFDPSQLAPASDGKKPEQTAKQQGS